MQNSDDVDTTLISKHHIESFDYLIGEGMQSLVDGVAPTEICAPETQSAAFARMTLSLERVAVGAVASKPFSCRLGGTTYSAPLHVTLLLSEDGGLPLRRTFALGEFPIMVRSRNCSLHGATSLAANGEDEHEPGGYFIVNGLEKILRSILVPRKNFPLGISRQSFNTLRRGLSRFAVTVRAAKAYRTQTLTLHQTSDGNAFIGLSIRKAQYLLPLGVVLRALVDASDYRIAEMLSAEGFDALPMIEDLSRRELHDRNACLRYLGFLLNGVGRAANGASDEQLGAAFLDRFLLIHLGGDAAAKVRFLCLLAGKLALLVAGRLSPDDLDALPAQEVLTAGQLLGMFLRERLEELLEFIRAKMLKDFGQSETEIPIADRLARAVTAAGDFVGKRAEQFLATGNLKSVSGLDLMQGGGLAILAERLNNARFFSHLRSLHRGAYFVEMKTTKVRKLLPESWGFVCPLNTPDGTLCGLLQHLAAGCVVQSQPFAVDDAALARLTHLCADFGMLTDAETRGAGLVPVLFDGRILGRVPAHRAAELCAALRARLKCARDAGAFDRLAIAHVTAPSAHRVLAAFPCVWLSLAEGRPLRQVRNTQIGCLEWLDAFEQSRLQIAVSKTECASDATHCEVEHAAMLSELAAQTPFAAHNPSARSMYQCQMAKQTMGTSTHALALRADNKMYRLTYPQLPLVRSELGRKLGFLEFPSGTNAVVAVLSYTGYDIEDGMIINKASYERGLMHGTVFKTSITDLSERAQNGRSTLSMLATSNAAPPADNDRADVNALLRARRTRRRVDGDGLPAVGAKLAYGDQQLQFLDNACAAVKTRYYKDNEPAAVEAAVLAAGRAPDRPQISLRLRYTRNPIVGDKFSSRHGQKGVLSFLWPQSDMPFTESGLTPDVIINPHAFSSRMTIGMLIECMAGKAEALDGPTSPAAPLIQQDWATLGARLERAGFNRLGTEKMYSGLHGTPLRVEVFQGLVYYQRLRHMVSDKAQARAVGAVDALTRQPVKGRKRGGGIRLGEMERDALVAHGASAALRERLLDSSDASEAVVCAGCGSMLGAFLQFNALLRKQSPRCRVCEHSAQPPTLVPLRVPFVLRYLANELAAMNVHLRFNIN